MSTTTTGRGEIFWTSYYDSSGVLRYQTTSNPARTRYHLYEVSGPDRKRLGSGDSPAELEKKFVRLS